MSYDVLSPLFFHAALAFSETQVEYERFTRVERELYDFEDDEGETLVPVRACMLVTIQGNEKPMRVVLWSIDPLEPAIVAEVIQYEDEHPSLARNSTTCPPDHPVLVRLLNVAEKRRQLVISQVSAVQRTSASPCAL